MLNFLTSNWIWILLIGGMLVMHLRHGHGGHGGGGGHMGHSASDTVDHQPANQHSGHDQATGKGPTEPAQGRRHGGC